MMATWTDFLTPFDELPAETKEIYNYDVTTAKSLLAAAGYATGFNTSIYIPWSFPRDFTELIVSYWAKIGVKCDIQVAELAQWNAVTFGGAWDKMVMANSGQSYPATNLMYFLTGSPYNYAADPDPTYQNNVMSILMEWDMNKKVQLIKDTSTYLLTKCWYLAMPTENLYTFWQPWVKGYHGEESLGTMNSGGVWARIWVTKH